MVKISNKEQFYRDVVSTFFAVLQENYREFFGDTLHFKVEKTNRHRDWMEVHFHIDLIPDWLFGFWFSKLGKDNMEYEFFGQYEETIDKFRPSHSYVRYGSKFNARSIFEVDALYLGDVIRQIHFVKTEPALAFARDYCGWNYNEEFHTRAEAQRKLDEYLKWKAEEKEWEPKCRQIVLDYVIENVMPYLPEFCIVDETENTSPRYNIMATYKIFENGTEENCGCYDIESFIEEAGGNAKKIMKGWYNADKEAEKLAKKHHVYYIPSCFHHSVCIIKNVNKYIKDLGYEKIWENSKH